MALKPWREVAIPHRDVLEGTFQQSEFAADLSRVHAGTASDEYKNPNLFYSRTYITEGMRLLLDSVIRRIAGQGGEPVVQLQTAFGGGKTHTMLAVYHLAKQSVPVSDLLGVGPIVDSTGVLELPKANVVVLDGIQLSPSHGQQHGSLTVSTMWGELAWQLGDAEAYEYVRDSDVNGTSPGKAMLIELLKRYSPCVILVDELVAYLRQFEEGKSYPGGSFDSNLSFIQALTEALKAVPNAMMLASLPESQAEIGSIRGQQALDALKKYFGRVQALWKPVGTEEAFEIVRRRLFNSIQDVAAAEEVSRTYAEMYVHNSADFPNEAQESRYLQRLLQSYPIHPEIFDRLYEDWSSLENFQRTRGVLKLMAKVIHQLWSEGNSAPMIQPSDVPLFDPGVKNELLYYLPPGWDPVIERDVDGERSEPRVIDRDSRFGAYQAARRTARCVFFGSAPVTVPGVTVRTLRGLNQSRILLGSVQPGQTIAVYRDALRRLSDSLHYLNTVNDHYYYDTRPNLRREMEERRRRFLQNELSEEIYTRITKWLVTKGLFSGLHVFTPASDIPDDESLRLIVLPTDKSYSRSTHNDALEYAYSILTTRGNQLRINQNRLIFLAADYESLQRLRENLRTLLAWQSILSDIEGVKLNLDRVQQKQAKEQFDQTQSVVNRTLRETFKWLLIPYQDERTNKVTPETKWEVVQVQTNAPDTIQDITNKLKESDLLISAWAPIHLRTVLQTWFWKENVPDASAIGIWGKMCQFLFLPRLTDREVFLLTINAGVSSRDFFAVAYGREEDIYSGFTFGQNATVVLDDSLLLIKPQYAEEYEERKRNQESDFARQPKTCGSYTGDGGYSSVKTTAGQTTGERTGVSVIDIDRVRETVAPSKRRFYGTVELNPATAKLEFSKIYDEVLNHFALKHDATVTISIEVESESKGGFDETFQRIVRENGAQLKFKTVSFEEE